MMSLLYGHMTLINPNNGLQLSNMTINLRQQVQLLERSPLEIPHQVVVTVYYVVLSLVANFLVSSYVCATVFKFGHQLQLSARGPLNTSPHILVTLLSCGRLPLKIFIFSVMARLQ